MSAQNQTIPPVPPDQHFQIFYEELSRRRYARWVMTFLLISSDLASLSLAFWTATRVHALLGGGESIPLSGYVDWMPGLGFFIFAYALSGLYPTVGMNPVDELRLLSKTTSIVFVLFMALSFWLNTPIDLSALGWALAWPAALVLTQLARWLLRIIARQFGIWGEAVVIIGTGPESQYVFTYIKDSVRLGIRPVATLDGDWPPSEDFPDLLKKNRIHTAILVVSEMSREMKNRIIDQHQYGFQRLILIPSMEWVYSLGVSTYDLEGVLGLEVKRNLLNRGDRFLKRCIDLILVVCGGIVISPLLFLTALLIRLDSPGKAIYKQTRVGVDGRAFKIWKFRTMVMNADQVLQKYLAEDPNLRAEWEATHKLKNDPRITRVGKVLRKFSLDEFPQLWNVLIGEMSLVGPRPIVQAEVEYYQYVFTLYKLVRPGITGMWQVSGRSDTGYAQRVRYDEYYIRNWSIWLDIYILLRTVMVVLFHKGAY